MFPSPSSIFPLFPCSAKPLTFINTWSLQLSHMKKGPLNVGLSSFVNFGMYEIKEVSLFVLKNIFHLFAAPTCEIFVNLKREN